MFFAYRTVQRIKLALAILGGYVLVSFIVAALFPLGSHSISQSAVIWAARIFLGLLSGVALEYAVTKLLDSSKLAQLSSPARVLLVVVGVLFIIGFVWFTWSSIYGHSL